MKFLIYIFCGCVALIVYVRFLEASSLFVPSRDVAVTPGQAGFDFEDIYFVTQDHVRLNGWLVKSAQMPQAAATILYCHGNAGNIGDRIEKLQDFSNLGVNVFIFDYRGFGKSQGRPTEQGMYRDALAAYDYLASREDIAKNRIVVYGASMGGVAAVDLASQRMVSALIADSTWTNAADMSQTIFPFVPSFLLTVQLDNANKIKEINVPKLFIHSSDDQTVPFRLGQKLFALAPEPKKFVQISGSHAQAYSVSKDVFLAQVEQFLDQYQLR